MARYTVIVLDGAGIGALPDAGRFGDEKAFTLKHVLEKTGKNGIPNLIKAGLLNIEGMEMEGESQPLGCFGKCGSQSKAKDTTSGHFEMMGLIMEEPYVVFGEEFPERIIQELEKRIGTKVIGNFPASGTEIIKDLGDEHCRTGYPIVYLSADSIMQIKRAYKTLYRNSLTLEEAKQQLAEQQKAVPELDILVDFLNHSTRGIVR